LGNILIGKADVGVAHDAVLPDDGVVLVSHGGNIHFNSLSARWANVTRGRGVAGCSPLAGRLQLCFQLDALGLQVLPASPFWGH
jgi:hypothetical protein